MAGFYNRAAAMQFAAEFWDRPCKSDTHAAALGLDSARDVSVAAVWDQRKAPAAKFELRYVLNPQTNRDDLVAVPKAGTPGKPVTILDGKKLEDCAHFLSQCLKAGGLRIREQWSVQMLVNELRAGEDNSAAPIAKTLAEKVPHAAAKAIVDSGLLKIGDLVAYFHDGRYAHCGMYAGHHNGTARITCHTKSRFPGMTPPQVNDAWDLGTPLVLFSLLHIPRTSESTPARSATLAGWWRLMRPAMTEFYFVRADGRAIRTSEEPKSLKAPVKLAASDSRGYWFEERVGATFSWRRDGLLAHMAPQGDGKSAVVHVAGAPRAMAAKLS